MQPAIELATKGFAITAQQAGEFNRYQERFKKHNPLGAAIIREAAWKEGDLFVQSELAETLKRIAEQGRDGFYKGKTAEYIVAEMKRGNGIVSMEDLANYQAAWRTPIVGNYKNYKIISMPPPSRGGVALLALLQSVEKYPLAKWDSNTTAPYGLW